MHYQRAAGNRIELDDSVSDDSVTSDSATLVVNVRFGGWDVHEGGEGALPIDRAIEPGH